MTLRQLIDSARQQAGAELSRGELEILLAHALDAPRSLLYAHPELQPPRERVLQFELLVQQRRDGHPIAYLTGQREFWSLPLQVTPHTLIPRPETELLVEQALLRIPDQPGWRVADLGTGSGAIALAVASERPHCEVWATDVCEQALTVARGNAGRLGLERVRFAAGSWLRPLSGRFHVLLSNPPYIDGADGHLELGDCRFEPRQALTPGEDGLSAICELCAGARDFLHPGGWLLLEHGFDQGERVRHQLQARGFGQVDTLKDLAGLDRISLGRSPLHLS